MNKENKAESTSFDSVVLSDGLIPMTEFIDKYLHTGDANLQIRTLGRYKDFLKQPLELEMLVPCSDDGVVLVEPINYDALEKLHQSSENETIDFNDYINYKKAKEKVLFEHSYKLIRNKNSFFILEDDNGVYISTINTIESLLKFSIRPKLTQSALSIIFE